MRSGPPRVVHELYDWLPGYGENQVSVFSNGGEATIDVEYGDRLGEGVWKRAIQFIGVCCMYRASFPGPTALPIALEPGTSLGSLVEFPASEAARAWADHFGGSRPIRHFGVWFLADNSTIQVFAENFSVTEALRLNVTTGTRA